MINIPIPDDDVIKTVTSLPRTPQNSGLIEVQLKRKFIYKTPYRNQFQDKAKLEKALDYLIQNHPSYYGMEKIDFSQLDQSADALDSGDEEMVDLSTESQTNNEVDDNPSLYTTTLIPENPELNVLVNPTSNDMHKKMKISSNVVHVVAPGEGKVPTYWLREKDFDTAAFPRHHPDGKFGLAEDRDPKISL